jgi:hypothetical protein
MYYEKDIKGDRNKFIARQAAEWLRVNCDLNTLDPPRFHGLYCFVEYNHVYAHGYSHTRIYNDKVKYLVLIEMLSNNRKNPFVAYIIDMQNNSELLLRESLSSAECEVIGNIHDNSELIK